MQQAQNFRHINIQIIRKLKSGLDIAEQHFKRPFSLPTLDYSLRGTKAGIAYLQQNHIKFNRALLLENTPTFIQQTVPHELAHLIVYQAFGQVKPHGKEWKFVMNELFQLPADTYHQFDVTNVQGKTVTYQCHCQLHHLSLRRHNKILRESAVYFCRKCKAELKAVEV